MNLYELTLSTYPKFEELGVVKGDFIKLKDIFLASMNGCSQSEKDRHMNSIQGEYESCGGCFHYENGKIISYDLRKINLVNFNIPAAYTDTSEYSLVFIFPEDVEEIQAFIDNEIKDLECVDNIRVALSSNPESVLLYEEARGNGCCGYMDKELVINNKTYLVGCNYGH
jgi:hypothetical protein